MLAVEMKDITKTFHGIKANDTINLLVEQGSIHALVGENGAGKSTLMKILYGMYTPDGGSISIHGSAATLHSPSDAITRGIGMVHQHFMLVPTLTVTENIILGQEPGRQLFRSALSRSEQEIVRLSENFSLHVPFSELAGKLSVGVQQRVEILKILYRNANILIFDEPTAVLTPQEVEALFSTLRKLKNQGKTIIIITHKVNEIMQVSDAVTVLRAGKVRANYITKNITSDEIVHSMIEEEIDLTLHREHITSIDEVLKVKNISYTREDGAQLLDNISLTVHSGEIFGIAGVEGSGQSALIEIISGLRTLQTGNIAINDEIMPNEGRTHAIAHIPEDRHVHGLILDFPLTDNIILGRHREKLFSSSAAFYKKNIREFTRTLVETFDIRPKAIDQPVRGFSGGNQQKIVIARELSKHTNFIIANQPTRGLDIGATTFVHQSLLKERNAGKAILLITSDLTELLSLSDRIGVMFEGKLIATFDAATCTENDLGMYMTGAYKKTA